MLKFTFSSCALLIHAIVSNAAVNLLCDWTEPGLFEIIDGTWSYIPDDCVVTQESKSGVNIAWLGSNNGNNPDDDYYFNNFVLSVDVSFQCADAGSVALLFRAENAKEHSTGKHFFYGLNAATDEIKLTRRVGGNWNNVFTDYSRPIELYTSYNLKVSASGTEYKFYLDDELVAGPLQLTDYSMGSIALRTWNTCGAFSNLEYYPKTCPVQSFKLCETFHCTGDVDGEAEDPNCVKPGEKGCRECAADYFLPNFVSPCTECASIEGCIRCDDWCGCGECMNGYKKKWDAHCDFTICKATGPQVS